MTLSATIVLLVKNGAGYLGDSLPAIYAQQADFDFRVLAIDSGSRDGSLEILARYPAHVVRIPPQTFDHGETRNLGAQLAGPGCDFVVYLSQDAEPHDETWLANLVRPLRDDPTVAGAFSRHLPRPTSSPAMVRQLTTAWQSGGDARIVKRMPEERALYERDRLHYAHFSNTSSVIRRSVWEGIRFPRTGFAEDAQWADAALRAGHAIVFEPTSVVIHSHDYPALEQFRQNVDHVAGMKAIFPGVIPRGPAAWLRIWGGIPLNVWHDWRFTWGSPFFKPQPRVEKVRWMLHSPIWHTASALGTWVGAHLSCFPAGLRLAFSRQERIRRGVDR